MGGSYQDQKKRKKLDKEFEELEAMGGENEKEAVKDTVRVMAEKEREKKEEKNRLLELVMGSSRGDKGAYHRFMAELLERRMNHVDWQPHWTYKIFPTKEGVVLEMYYGKRIFRLAFAPCGDAVYDLNAVDTFGVRAQNTIDRITKESLQVEKIKTNG